ncbi:MAG TPA: MarR family transcriptional regulator [Bauldia sp.]|nr:MarR family transcriptional regulator [Bauldia sp.]
MSADQPPAAFAGPSPPGPVEDVIGSLGHLTLGSRLRRIGERLQADTQRIIDEAGVAFPVSQFPILAAIDRLGPLSVGDLALALRVSQPGVTRAASLLVRGGYIRAKRVRGDQRVRRLELTAKGADLIGHAKRTLWPRIEAAVAGLCGDLSGPLLGQLAAVEAGLDEASLLVRAAAFGGDRDGA